MGKIWPLEEAMNTCSVYFTKEKKTSYEAAVTQNHWVNYSCQKGSASENFANFTEGNEAKAFLGGKEYFEALIYEFENAQKTIYITGWQVNWDAQLKPDVRLVDSLLQAAMRSAQLKIYIMPWANMVIETYAAATERVFAALNQHLGRDAFFVQLAGSKSGSFFSHHQKCVIVDESVAFVGGIDLAYGRYDDGRFSLKADAEGRQGLNQYNACIASISQSGKAGYDPMREQLQRSQGKNTSPPDIEQAEKKAAQHIIEHVLDPDKKYWQSSGDNTCLDPAFQPRQPWQDYQVRIYGPAVNDLVKNFILRWNSYGCQKSKPSLLETTWPELTFTPSVQPEKGCCQIQVLRSASLKMRKDEFKHSPVLQKNTEPKMLQDDIRRCMLGLIQKAENYIYIENQFFISAFGEPSIPVNDDLGPIAASFNMPLTEWGTRKMPGDAWAQPKNQIVEWLSDKLKWVIFGYKPQPFHIYIVLPVHPEGMLNDGTIVAQIHQTRQSLVFGGHSLMNRIRRYLWVKQQLEAQGISRAEWYNKIQDLEKKCGKVEYETIPFSACNEYITLLNLRNHDTIDGKPVTEQIYVHSKLMIVDDRYVLVGSANINERSLQGDHDSELAVLISDTANGTADIDGNGNQVPCRNFARNLRIDAWKKLLGAAATEDILNKPAAEKTWQAIRDQAKINTKAYEAVFNFIPRDYPAGLNEIYTGGNNNISEPNKTNITPSSVYSGASLWPVWNGDKKHVSEAELNMPFSIDFCKKYKNNRFNNQSKLSGIKGYITLLPLYWTEKENNLVPYHSDLISFRQPDNRPDTQMADVGNEEQNDEVSV
ncbi:phospholipase D-like domain-containing protein [Citrobacter sp. wls718]|uniref:phospholipase D-like domain-containing protein n=1 Tax=Citrobacter sp. wls718 TaxID=2576418 RepID=UPI000E0788CC|nr:phospholipase D-like domain-containing protein [Citrobacter sp. wls718]TKU25658.1 phospholipase [Citrobacter sp. wls718]STE15329.1 cardiolipin synthetase [Escherichia coli]